jgi:aryl-alcohol dehydrogenase-like predicted oxidoreductase/predicted kinase
MTSLWLAADELRIGLGCMRLSTDADRDERRALETLAAAVEAGVTVFDTARAYGPHESELGHNEQLLARALRLAGAERRARVVTKGGMARPAGAWIPDGRAKAIRADCEASLAALDGLPIDLYLLHAPDPRTPWRTSVRALAKLVDDGHVARVGVANVSRDQLDEALELAPISAVQVPMSPFDDSAFRSGLFDRCLERDLQLIAHSPLGGPRRAGRLARHEVLARIARTRGASAAEVALAWLLALAPNVLATPGARRPESARSAAGAAGLALADEEKRELDESLGHRTTPARRAGRRSGADVVLVMGIPGAGKSRMAEEYVKRGFVRLNRDERGGSLRELAGELEAVLGRGAPGVVLDNTYLTRVARSHVVEAARRHGASIRCVWLDTPLAQAQVNLVERLLERFGSLPAPDELTTLARTHAGVLTPTSQMRTFRELEPPDEDEGFVEVRRVEFERLSQPGRSAAGVLVAAAAVRGEGWREAVASAEPSEPHLVFDWRPEGDVAELDRAVAAVAAEARGPVEAAVCPHPGGPPVCWCRPPLPGMPLVFARAHGLDLGRSIVIGASPAHRTLANALGSRYIAV